jgi:hypothetical protein
MYRVPKLPYPLGKNFSFGIGFPSVLGTPSDMSTVVELQPGPIATADNEIYIVPSSTVTLRHDKPYYQLYMYGDPSTGFSLVAVSASREEDIANVTTSSPYTLWLYTVRMRSTWIDSVIPRDCILISDASGGSTASEDDNPILSDGYCYKCPRRWDGAATDGDGHNHPGDTVSGEHPGDGGVDAGDGGVDSGDTLHPFSCPPCLYGKTLPPQ